jgi:hypothetical protein
LDPVWLAVLHYKGLPYKPNGGAWGTQNKTAFNNAKRRAIANVMKRYDEAIISNRNPKSGHSIGNGEVDSSILSGSTIHSIPKLLSGLPDGPDRAWAARRRSSKGSLVRVSAAKGIASARTPAPKRKTSGRALPEVSEV